MIEVIFSEYIDISTDSISNNTNNTINFIKQVAEKWNNKRKNNTRMEMRILQDNLKF